MNILSFSGKDFPESLSISDRYKMDEIKTAGKLSKFVSKEAQRTNRAQSVVNQLALLMPFWGYPGRKFSIGTIPGGAYAAILVDEDGGKQAAVLEESAALKAQCWTPDGTPVPYDASTRHGSVVALAVIAYAAMEPENGTTLIELVECMNAGTTGSRLGHVVAKLSSNIYYRTKISSSDKYSLAFVNDINCLKGDITGIDNLEALESMMKPIIECPGVRVLPEKKEEKSKARKSKTVSSKGLSLDGFRLSKRKLTKVEKTLVPKKDEKFTVSKWMVSILRKLCSPLFDKPFRNLLLIGEAGCGKSKFSMALATALNLPFMRFTCGPDTTQIDLLGGILPRTGKTLSLDDVLAKMGEKTLRAVDEALADINKALEEKPEDESLLAKLSSLQEEGEELTKKGLAEMEKLGKESDFVYQKSTIIEAIEKGYVVEIQEPTVIKRPSVLVSLNALLEDDLSEACMTLSNGDVVQRHPDAVVVMTANPAYVGCAPIQQSVLSRMQIVKRLNSPSVDTMTQRVLAETGCADSDAVLKMTKVLKEISEYCKEKGITDGTTGMRELSAWVKSAMEEEEFASAQHDKISDESMIRAAFDTVLTHVSQEEEDLEDVLGAVFEKTFNLALVERLRAEAE